MQPALQHGRVATLVPSCKGVAMSPYSLVVPQWGPCIWRGNAVRLSSGACLGGWVGSGSGRWLWRRVQGQIRQGTSLQCNVCCLGRGPYHSQAAHTALQACRLPTQFWTSLCLLTPPPSSFHPTHQAEYPTCGRYVQEEDNQGEACQLTSHHQHCYCYMALAGCCPIPTNPPWTLRMYCVKANIPDEFC